MSRCSATLFAVMMLGSAGGYAETWPMRNRDMHNTGRADFTVPASRLNDTFFDVIRWQKPSPCCDGAFTSTAMVFFDGVGPGAADIVAAGYHWPKGVQGMDRHTGKLLWYGNPGGGETIGRSAPAFSSDGASLYVINDAWDHPLMALPTAIGPSAWRGLANPSDPNAVYLGFGSPLVAPDGRIFSWGWNLRAAGVTDNGTNLSITWVADADVGTCLGGNAICQYGPSDLRIISAGRFGVVRSHSGATGATIWSRDIPGTDSPPTVDPATGRIYIPFGSGDVYIIGLSKDGANLWGSNPWVLVYDYTGANAPHAARATGCLSHDGQTLYFQTTTDTTPGEGRLWAIRTSNGSVKWSYPTQGTGTEMLTSSPIVTPNGVIIVGNALGHVYFAIQDNGTSATLLDSFAVDGAGEATAVPSLSADGLLYVPVRTPWIASNGNTDAPSFQVANVYTAFDLNEGAQMYDMPPEGPLAAPTGLTVTPYYSTAHVYWIPLTDPGVAGYAVYRRTAGGPYTVPLRHALRSSFTDYGLAPGQTYYYMLVAVDGSGAPVSHFSAERGATLATNPGLYSTHKNMDVLIVVYKGGFTQAQVDQITAGLKLAMSFYWRTTRGRLNMDPTWMYIDGYPPADQWGWQIENDLRSRGVHDNQFDLAYLAGNNLAGCLGGYLVLGSTCAALGNVCGVPYPGKSMSTNYTITWTFTHELHHALEMMENITDGTPEVLFDHFPWCYPDPLGPTGWHMDWGTHYDGIALTNRQYGDQWMLYPAPYDGYIECVDADGDDFPDNDTRVWMDEARFGSSPAKADTDADGLDDLAEFSAYNFRGTNPTNPDTDGDGLPDGVDPQPLYAIGRYLPHLRTPLVIDGTIETDWPRLATGYYFTQNTSDFTLSTYAGWDENALYVAVESTQRLRFMLSVDGSGQDGRFESPVRHVTGTTDTLNPNNKDQQIGDTWGDGNHIHWDYGGATAEVYGRATIADSQVASTDSGGMYRTEVRIPRALPPGAAYTWYPPGDGTPVVDGLTLRSGHIVGLNLTVSNYGDSDGGEFSGTWTSLFETHSYVDFVLQSAGDVNCDGLVDFDDINPFVTALVSRDGYEAAFPECSWLNADVDGNGAVDFDDINPFVACLVAGECQ